MTIKLRASGFLMIKKKKCMSTYTRHIHPKLLGLEVISAQVNDTVFFLDLNYCMNDLGLAHYK